jgi:hypothetical protein
LIITALQWCGSAYVGLSTDDYHYLQHLAPLDGIADIPGAFLKSDANPQYWRPVSNATLTADFLLYGYKGGGYHITNLLLHLLATGLVFFSCRRLFKFDLPPSIFAALLFGLSAGHDSNLLWIAARGDILATIFSITTLLLLDSERRALRLAALPIFFLALCSKELALMVIPIAMLFQLRKDDRAWMMKWRSVAVTLFSLIAIATVYFVCRSNFTVPATEAQPMLGEGMQSALTAIKNVIYGIAYVLAPLDISTASTVLTQYKTEALILAGVVVAGLGLVLARSFRSFNWRSLLLSFVLSAFFAVTVAQSFERWRLYAPSVGLFAIISILAVHLWKQSKQIGRSLLVVVLLAFVGFHVYRASVEKQSWRLASELLQDVKHDLRGLIAEYGDQPLFLITQPSKIGGGSVMKVSSSRLLLQAKAELLKPEAIGYADTRGLQVDHKYGLLVLALDPDEAFSPINVARTSANTYRVTVPPNSSTRIQPELIVTGSNDRERSLHDGDTLSTMGGTVIIHKADRNYATDVTLIAEPSDRIPVYFNGKSVIALP